jgi:hypothetical protein
MKRSKKHDIFLLLLETVNREVDEHNFYLKATGTAESIKAWGEELFGNDADQQRAFQILYCNSTTRQKRLRQMVSCTLLQTIHNCQAA